MRLSQFGQRAAKHFPYQFTSPIMDDARRDAIMSQIKSRFGDDAMPEPVSEPHGVWTFYRHDTCFVFFFLHEIDAVEARLMVGI